MAIGNTNSVQLDSIARQKATEAQRQQVAWRKIEDARSGWLRFIGEIQSRVIDTGDVWLERMQMAGPSAESELGGLAAGQPLRMTFSGLMRPSSFSVTQ